MKYNYIFGPIPSRRLGISLGVDLVNHKVCSLNCVYCEAGKTTTLTTERKEYIPTNAILEELDHYLAAHPQLDHITFSGAGEPTLHSGLGEIAAHIKTNYPEYKLALITNGTLFYLQEVRDAVRQIDCILPSLDAVSDEAFYKINRPSSILDNKKIIEGLVQLRAEFTGEIHLELFIVPGINDNEQELALLKEAMLRISPDKVQLNTLDRPGTETWIRIPKKENLEKIAAFLAPLPVEIIAKFSKEPVHAGYRQDLENAVIETIRRRPCTMQDLATTLGKHINEVDKYVAHLVDIGTVIMVEEPRGVFYKLK